MLSPLSLSRAPFGPHPRKLWLFLRRGSVWWGVSEHVTGWGYGKGKQASSSPCLLPILLRHDAWLMLLLFEAD